MPEQLPEIILTEEAVKALTQKGRTARGEYARRGSVIVLNAKLTEDQISSAKKHMTDDSKLGKKSTWDEGKYQIGVVDKRLIVNFTSRRGIDENDQSAKVDTLIAAIDQFQESLNKQKAQISVRDTGFALNDKGYYPIRRDH